MVHKYIGEKLLNQIKQKETWNQQIRLNWLEFSCHIHIYIYIHLLLGDPYILTIRPALGIVTYISPPPNSGSPDTSLIQGGCTLELRLDGKQVEGSMGYKLLINEYTPEN